MTLFSQSTGADHVLCHGSAYYVIACSFLRTRPRVVESYSSFHVTITRFMSELGIPSDSVGKRTGSRI